MVRYDKNSNEFNAKVKRILEGVGKVKAATPWELVDYWDSFVKECEEGYDWILSEYSSDAWMRRCIDVILSSPDMKRHPDYPNFARRVEKIDNRLREILSDEVLNPDEAEWWLRHPLRSAGSEYADDVRRIYGIDIEVEPPD